MKIHKNSQNAHKMDVKKTFSFNPLDLVRINATPLLKERILSRPECCLAYRGCMELLPGAKALIAAITEQADEIEITLDAPVSPETTRMIAEIYHIPYGKVVKSNRFRRAGDVAIVGMRFKQRMEELGIPRPEEKAAKETGVRMVPFFKPPTPSSKVMGKSKTMRA